MRALLFTASAGLVACSFDLRPGAIPGSDGATDPDAMTDSDAVSADTGPNACLAWTFTPAELDPCAIPAPGGVPGLTSGTYIIDTDTGAITGPGVAAMLPHVVVNGVGVVSVASLTVPSGIALRGQGSVPLAIVSWGTIAISGSVDVSSALGGIPGAGGNPPICSGNGGGGTGIANFNGDGGGGGGGFSAVGGRGGHGASLTTNGGAAGVVRARPAIVAGGCRGGNAATGDGGVPGVGGNGGGAVALIAKDSLTLAGTVHAGGSGGTGGVQSQSGGGGGGSGGMIKLEAATVTLDSTSLLAANGGQGGGGCDGAVAGNGANGAAAVAEAAQGNSQGAGTDGGGGGWLNRGTGNTASTSSDGGGGGGGGVGYIVYKGHPTATVVAGARSSPASAPF